MVPARAVRAQGEAPRRYNRGGLTRGPRSRHDGQPVLTPRRTHFVDSSDGVRLPVYDFGGDGPLLLVAHATGFHGRVYDAMLGAIAGFRRVSVDLRGHGDARMPAGLDLRWESFAGDLAAVLDDLAPAGPVFAFGHSMGGACLLMVEERRPGTFAGLFCYEPVVYPPDMVEDVERLELWLAMTRKRRASFPTRQAALDNYRGKGPYARFDERALADYVDHGFAAGDDRQLHLKCRPENEARMYLMGPQQHVFAALPSLRCPVTVACGGLREPGPGAWAERVVQAIPGARLETFDGLGHMGPMEDPERVAAAVAESFSP